MAKKKMGGLGKGLDSLFADLSDDTGSEASNSTLPLREIEPDPEQPRKRFDDDTIRRLQAVRWWDWEPERIRRYIGALRAGRLHELEEALRGI